MSGQTYEPSEQDVVEYVEKDPSGRYVRYNEVLGKGAFKTVYRAFDQLDGIEVAWNRIRIGGVLNGPEHFRKVYSEVLLLNQLRHENVMKIYHSWIDAKKITVNMITELFTSRSLRQFRTKNKNADLKAMKNWATQILRGLDYLHSQNPPIIHRDLKCDNIFVNGNHGQVKIGDFGLATAMRQQKNAVGTPEYMAPELYKEEYDQLIDIYAFGMCMLEMVTLEYPYSECKNALEIKNRVTHGVKPASLCNLKDRELKQFIEKCLVRASDRLSAKELLKDPFLVPEGVKKKETTNEKLKFPPPNHVSPSSSFLNVRPQSMDIDPEYCWSSCTDSSPNTQCEPPILEFEGVHHNKLFQLKGKNIDGNSISLSLRIVDILVAGEMVEQLSLEDHNVSFVGNLIDYAIKRISHSAEVHSPAGHKSGIKLRTTTTTCPTDMKQDHHHNSSKVHLLDASTGGVGVGVGEAAIVVASGRNDEIMDEKGVVIEDNNKNMWSSSSGQDYEWKVNSSNALNSGMSNEKSSEVSMMGNDSILLKVELDEIEFEYQKHLEELDVIKQVAIDSTKKKWMKN